ncbi:MAG TPA: amino acid permease [Phycisphaerae bacterium]|nr:amino acid permease [Phycisphaerae bacterium]
MADRPAISGELSRDLNLFHITMMGLGMMIGAGVFVGIGICMSGAGPGGLLVAFALNGLIALFSAMSFAELSSAIPRAGGAYNFARIGFGRGPSFLTGWMEWLASSAAGGFYAVTFARYTVGFFAGLGLLEWLPLPLGAFEKVVALAAAGLFIFINYRGSSETGKVGALFTVGQMLFVVAVGVVGIAVAVAQPDRLANFKPFIHPDGWWKLLGVMGVIYVAFEGFEVIAQAGDETIEPRRNVPKAMLYSVLIVTVTYVAVAFASVVAVRSADIGGQEAWRYVGEDPEIGFQRAVEHLMPSKFFGNLLVTLAVIFSATSALNATIYSATRASYALGRDGMLPPYFARISPTRRTPYGALSVTAVLVFAVAIALRPKHAGATASIMFLFLFFVVNLCVIRIRRNMGDELTYGYLMPLFPLFPVLAIGCQVLLAGAIVTESWIAWAIALVWVPLGVVTYRAYSRHHAVATADEIHVLEERRAEPGEGYRIMVAVANPDNALSMIRTTYKLCGAKDARVELVHMVPVPEQVPLTDADRYMLEGKEGILETMLYLAPQFPLSTTIRYCRNIARGIVSAVREKRADMLILGWHGRRRRSRVFRIGSTVDPIIERAPCDVVVLKDCGGNRTFRRVLVPVAGGPNSPFALEVAGILAEPADGEITVLTVGGRKTKGFDLNEFVAAQLERNPSLQGRVWGKTVWGRDVVGTILQQAEDYDLVVLGCTSEPILRRMAHYPVPETVAQRCGKPLVMVKAGRGLRSWVKRWI